MLKVTTNVQKTLDKQAADVKKQKKIIIIIRITLQGMGTGVH